MITQMSAAAIMPQSHHTENNNSSSSTLVDSKSADLSGVMTSLSTHYV